MSMEPSAEIAIPQEMSFSADKNTRPGTTARELALRDMIDGTKKWRIWMTLAYQDIKVRYRRSVLGPFWLTLSMAITTYSMGYLYSHLFHTDLQIYFPFLVSGMLSWALISGSVNELIDSLVGSEGMIKQIKLPYSLYIHRVATRNILVFLHNSVVIIPIIAIFHKVAKLDLNTLLLIPGLLIIYFNSITYGIVLAVIGARYRDLSQVIKSMIQVIFFLTPIMWQIDVLPPNKRFFALLNPFASFVQIIREPLMGRAPHMRDFIMVGIFSLIGLALCYRTLVKYRARIVYWL